MSRIRKEYVNTGKVRFVYKHFAILGSGSNLAAEASECAAEQDQFWDYHDLVFADLTPRHNALSEQNLIIVAANIGLDTTSFKTCLNSGRYRDRIIEESEIVEALGVPGTPAFLVNGVFISGAQSFEAFQQVIEEQLASAK